jgi:hypothetical protein
MQSVFADLHCSGMKSGAVTVNTGFRVAVYWRKRDANAVLFTKR